MCDDKRGEVLTFSTSNHGCVYSGGQGRAGMDLVSGISEEVMWFCYRECGRSTWSL